MPANHIEYPEIQNCPQNEVFESKEDMNRSLSRLCYGDLYLIGRIWIEALKSGLVGSKWSLIPVVEAARPPPPPEKPPLMRSFRRSLTESCCEISCEFNGMKKDAACALRRKKNNFVSYMRDPQNLQVRQAVVAIGGAAGLYAASAKGLPSKFFCTGLGLLAAGALCFPKETDEAFRTFTYHTGKTAIAVYNFYCNKVFGLRERLPCPDDMPPSPQYRKPNVCPKK